ncbi:MAG TPA: hypothetical protein VF552_10520, partial [Allosphingosinicella sp.]
MLKGPPSLALRAGLIFISIYVAVFAAFLALLVFSRALNLDEDPYAGAHVALSFADDELSEAGGTFALPADGAFARLAARNPGLWLVARSETRSFTFGPVPPAALRLLGQYHGPLDSGRFRVPGMAAHLAPAKIERRGAGTDALLLAAGGIDTATISAGDSLRLFGPKGVLIVLIVIALLGLVAMAVSLPLFTRAIRPIAAEAGSVVPQEPGRRLDEGKAPRELLPL